MKVEISVSATEIKEMVKDMLVKSGLIVTGVMRFDQYGNIWVEVEVKHE